MSKGRHRRVTVADHIRRIGSVVAFVAAAIGLLYAVPSPASADGRASQEVAAVTEETAVPDYGSGYAGGPVGSQVLSLPDYTSRSDWIIFGDSITKGGYKTLAGLKPDNRLAVNAHAGRNTKLTVDSLQQMIADGYQIPDRVVWATGTNDVFDPFVMPAQLARMFASLPDSVEQVYMVDVQVNRPSFPGDQRNSMLVNKAIWEACAKDSRCTLISWAGFLAAKPSYRLSAYIDAGGVHPTVPTGYNAWAALIAGRVQLP